MSFGNRRHVCRRVAPLLALTGCLLVAGPARANQVPGATYSGTLAGGGTIAFTVTPDGRRVSSHRITAAGDTCVFVANGDEGAWPGAPIEDGAFSYRLFDAFVFTGSFPATRSASGTYRLTNPAVPGRTQACDTGTVAWTAVVDDTPPPTGSQQPGSAGAPGSEQQPATGQSGAFGPLPPGARTYRTTVLLRTRNKTKLTGQIKSVGSGCKGGRTVTVKRGAKTLATAKTNVLGFFKLKRTAAMRGQRIRLTVSARRRPAHLCAAGASRTVRLPKR